MRFRVHTRATRWDWSELGREMGRDAEPQAGEEREEGV